MGLELEIVSDENALTAPPNRSKSQKDLILDHLKKHGSIGLQESLFDRDLGINCSRLAARIWDLRKEGHAIVQVDRTLPNGKKVARYEMNIDVWGQRRLL